MSWRHRGYAHEQAAAVVKYGFEVLIVNSVSNYIDEPQGARHALPIIRPATQHCVTFAAACNSLAMETNTRFTVDAKHCQRAEDELYAMLLRQDVAFAARWQFNPAANFVFKIALAAGLLASLLGLALTLAFLVLGSPSWAVPPDPWYLPVFGAGLVFFCLLPRMRPSLQASTWAWARRLSEKSCRRHAQRCIRDARRFAPFEAHYDFNGSLLVYSRAKDSRKIVWRRDLFKYRDRGFALRGASVTAIFRRPGSFGPSVVILQDSSDWLTRVLQDTGIASAQAATSGAGDRQNSQPDGPEASSCSTHL